MKTNFRASLLFVLVVALLALGAACGGSDDSGDDDDASADSGSSGNTPNKSKKSVTVPKISDGAYGSGKIHIEITGDKKQTVDLEGGGFASGGALVLTYGDTEVSSFLSFSSNKGDEAGGMVITTKQVATAGAWGEECDFTFSESGDSVSGEFTCEKIEALEVGSAKSHRITVKAKFSLKR